MKAFENVTMTKQEMIEALKWHQEQDNFVRGEYFRDGKGCAVGCSLESVARTKNISLKDFGNHSLYETYLGIPEWLARVEDTIFEGVGVKRSKTWPLEFIEAVNTGANLENVKAPFLIFVLESNLERLKDVKFKQQREAVEGAIALWKRSDIGTGEWEFARPVVESAAESAARSAARSAAWSAESAARSAWSAAWSAAESAARSAWSAAESAARSAWSAAWSAARSARSARSAAWSAAHEKFADELLRLMRECK